MIQTACKQILIRSDASCILYNSRAYKYLHAAMSVVVARHKYKILGLGCGLVLAPILHISIGLMYNIYKFAYRTYYLYFLLAAIQSNTCNWISTPSVMCINALINYAFDY